MWLTFFHKGAESFHGVGLRHEFVKVHALKLRQIVLQRPPQREAGSAYAVSQRDRRTGQKVVANPRVNRCF